MKSHFTPCHFCSKAKPIGREKGKKTIIIVITFAWLNCMLGRKVFKYLFDPCHFYTCLQLLEQSLKVPSVLMTHFDFQAFWLGAGGKTKSKTVPESSHSQFRNRYFYPASYCVSGVI